MNRAAVFIPEKLFFKIGEVCELTGVQAHVLRYWESEFPMLAPQKNRAGQRTYRKRDVEMALRIKELLYEDQYTIAGAKKKLSSELRGASKLKVVTPEMSAASTAQTTSAPQVAPPTVAASPQAIMPAASAPSNYESEAKKSFNESPAAQLNAPITEDQHRAMRHLAHQLRDLLSLLEANDSDLKSTHK